MNWYVRTTEGEFGPLPLEVLVGWAREARILATDEVRPALPPDAEWTPAAAVPEIGLFWRIHFDDGSTSQPMHADAIAGAVRDGTFQSDWPVEDVRTGERFRVVEVVCASLFGQVERLAAALEEAENRLATGGGTPAAPASPTEWQTLIRELDTAKREAAKYRKFLDDELGRSRAREEGLERMVEQYKAGERAFEERIRLLTQSREKLEADLRATRGGARAASPAEELVSLRELADGQRELGRELTRLQEQMVEQERMLQDARRERDAAEQDARDRVRKLEEVLSRERQEAQKARDQMVRLEHKHREMLSAYRELSDRLIQMRNDSLQRGAKSEPAAAPAAPAPEAPAPRGDGPRVRLR